MINGLAKRLTEQRLMSNRSIKEVATSVGVTPSTLSNYEHGYRVPSLEKLVSLQCTTIAPLITCSVSHRKDNSCLTQVSCPPNSCHCSIHSCKVCNFPSMSRIILNMISVTLT